MKFDRLLHLLASDVDAGRIPGAVALVAQAGQIQSFDSVGWLGPGRADAMTDDAIFWIASMTKPITSVAALMLVEAGLLRLDAPVSHYLPQLAALSVQGGLQAPAPTVLDLLRHTSGLTYGFFGSTPVHAAYMAAGVHDFHQSGADMLRKLSGIALLYSPGTTFEYGMSTDVLACVVESCSGQPFDAFLQQKIFHPLEMHSTGFQVPATEIQRIARPLPQEDFSIAPPPSGSRWLSGGAGLWSTTGDYFRFAQMLLNGGELAGARLLQPETVRAMLQNQLPAAVQYGSYIGALGALAPTPAMGRGFGLGLSVRLSEGGAVAGSPGDFTWPGVSGTNFWCDPVHQLVVVVMMQAPSLRGLYREQSRACVYADLASA